MSKTWFVLPLLVLTALPTHADPSSDARKAIQSLYNRQDAAAARRDANGTFAGRSPQFVSIDKNGRHTPLAQEQQRVTGMFANATKITAATQIAHFTLQGSKALVTVKEKARLFVVNPRNKAQKADLQINSVSNDIWTKTPSGWQELESKEISGQTLVNGKPVK